MKSRGRVKRRRRTGESNDENMSIKGLMMHYRF